VLGVGAGGGGNGGGGRGGGGCRGFTNIRVCPVQGVSVFRAVSSHVALDPATETPALGAVLGAFFVSQFTERNRYICRVDVHRDVLAV
jgi:hypothetical protein